MNPPEIKTIVAPPLDTMPDSVRAALNAQDKAFAALLSHVDDTEYLLAADWQDRAEAAMLVHAAAGEPFEGLLDQRRIERVEAITTLNRLEADAKQAARAARDAVHGWFRQPGVLDQVDDLEQAGRDEELADLEQFQRSRSAWRRTAAIRQWAAACAAASAPDRMPDYTGRPTGPGGLGIDRYQIDQVAGHVNDEHQRADAATENIASSMSVTVTGSNSGIRFNTHPATAQQLERGDELAEIVDGPRRDSPTGVGAAVGAAVNRLVKGKRSDPDELSDDDLDDA